MNTPPKVEVLKCHLGELTFAKIVKVIPNDQGFYFGFAEDETGKIYFQANNQTVDEDFCCLGIATRQDRRVPPKDEDVIVGRWAMNPRGRRFRRWALCTKEEKLFVDYMLGKKCFSVSRMYWIQQLNSLCVIRDDVSSRLMSMAVLLILRDLGYFLDLRKRHGGEIVDLEVLGICSEYDLGLWEGYKRQALAQGIYSNIIPAYVPLTPRPIVSRTDLDAMVRGESVPLCTPFTGLKA